MRNQGQPPAGPGLELGPRLGLGWGVGSFIFYKSRCKVPPNQHNVGMPSALETDPSISPSKKDTLVRKFSQGAKWAG